MFAWAHLLVASTAGVVAIVRGKRGARLLAGGALAGLAIVTLLASKFSPSVALLLEVMTELCRLNRRAILAVALGLSTAVPWLLLPFPYRRRSRDLVPLVLSLLLFCSPACLVVAVSAISYRDFSSRSPYSVPLRTFDSRFVADEVASLSGGKGRDVVPICVAVDENDNVFISVHYTTGEDYSGRIYQLVENADKVRLHLVASSPCLFRTFGLAARHGQLFVSRAGFLAKARNGHIDYENSGFITRLSDLDHDGMMDYYEDVVSGLPGCQGPVSQHGNNAIAFGPDGSLYITQGVHSDRDVPNHPWEGTILRASPDFQTVSVFAKGLRNPFGLSFGPDSQLFATDNDVANGNPGDELNLIKEGAHYGHPYVVGNDDGGGKFAKPLLLWQEGNFAGLAFSGTALLPAEYQNCLYIADYSGNRIVRVSLRRTGNSYSAVAEPFMSVASPIGVGVTRSGTLFISSFEGFVFRVRLKGSSSLN